MTPPTLTTARLALVPPHRDLFDAHAALFADPRVMTHMGSGPQSRQEAWRRYGLAAGLWQLLGYGYWSVLDRASGALIGNAGLGRFERGIAALEGFPEIGWAVGADWWGRGIATECGNAITAWADAALGAELRCLVAVENAASVRVAEKLGFAVAAQVVDAGDACVVMRRASRVSHA
jgi:RimJ/RimL family protein N-acetyltransferase